MKLTLYFHFLLVALGGAAIGLKSINLWYRPGRWKLCLNIRWAVRPLDEEQAYIRTALIIKRGTVVPGEPAVVFHNHRSTSATHGPSLPQTWSLDAIGPSFHCQAYHQEEIQIVSKE